MSAMTDPVTRPQRNLSHLTGAVAGLALVRSNARFRERPPIVALFVAKFITIGCYVAAIITGIRKLRNHPGEAAQR